MRFNKRLKKELGLFDVFCIATGAMISSGLFILPGIASAKAGPALFVSYVIAALLSIPAMLSKAELVTAMPKAGGDYFFITRSMGLGVGTISGLASWFSLSLKSAFALIGMSAYAALITDMPISLIAVFLCVFFVILNIRGIKEAGILQIYLVVGLLAAMAFYVFRGFSAVEVSRFSPLAPNGFGSIMATAGFVFISYGGLTKIASISEEVKDPGKNIPAGMILSLITVGIFYALVVFVTTGVLDPEKFQHSLTPISDGARMFMGNFGGTIMAIAAILAFVSTANAGIMAASRYPIAMSRDNVLPPFFEKVNRRFQTPHNSIVFTGIFMILAIIFLRLELLVEAASTFLILLFISANLAVIIMRESKIQNYQPKFKSPFYPLMQIAGIISGIFLLFEMGPLAYAIVGIFILTGILWYRFYVRPHTEKEFALIHVIERITNKALTTYTLEDELREVLRERDEVVEDRFDYLIKRAEILDLKDALNLEDFFKTVARSLARNIDVAEDTVFNLLMEREKETTTAIRPGLAIPHIIIDGNKKFEILLARCKKGIEFSPSVPPVNAVFVLIGTRDERNFHLRALASIAQITEEPGFDGKWQDARNPQELRDIVLLGKRSRYKFKRRGKK